MLLGELFSGTRQIWTLCVLALQCVFLLLVNPGPKLTAAAGVGATTIWATPQLLSLSADDGAFIPVLRGASDGRMIVAYNHLIVSSESEYENPYFLESSDGGRSWQDGGFIYQDQTRLLQVNLTFDGDNMAHAVWRTENEIWHAREDQWPQVAHPITTTTDLVFSPDIAVGPDNTLHAVWAQEDNRLYHAQSADGGTSWTPGTAISTGATRSDRPDIAVDGSGDLHVVWEETVFDGEAFRYEVRYKLGSLDKGTISWPGEPTKLSGDIINAQQPVIVVQDGEIHVAFARRDSRTEQYAYYTRFDSGTDPATPVNVSGDPVIVNHNVPVVLIPSLTLCDETAYVYFHGALVENGKEVLLGVSSADGWNTRDFVEVGDSRAIRPSAICSGGKMHVVYEKVITPNSDHQVYYISGNRYAAYLPIIRH